MLAADAPPVVEDHDIVRIVRDDLLDGGTKVRALPAVLYGGAEFVYAGPAQGYAQLALAVAARDLGVRATVFVPERRVLSPVTAAAQRRGAIVVSVPAGRLSVLQYRARSYCAATGATLLPFGLDTPCMREGLSMAARRVPEPREAWVAAGSGMLASVLADAWPGCAVNAVQVGRVPSVPSSVRVWKAPEDFADPAKGPLPPVPSATNYDAKVWRFVAEHASPGALWWNVAGDPLE